MDRLFEKRRVEGGLTSGRIARFSKATLTNDRQSDRVRWIHRDLQVGLSRLLVLGSYFVQDC
jgi:hypothetical protein